MFQSGTMGQARSQMALMSQKLWQSASEIRQTASLTYDQFLDSISTLNELLVFDLRSCLLGNRIITLT